MGHPVARIQHDTSRPTGGVQRKDSLDGDIDSWRVEGVEHDLSHLFTVGLGIEGSLREKDGVVFRRDAQFIVDGVVPNLFHVVPVGNDTVLDRIFQGKDAPLSLSLVTEEYQL